MCVCLIFVRDLFLVLGNLKSKQANITAGMHGCSWIRITGKRW